MEQGKGELLLAELATRSANMRALITPPAAHGGNKENEMATQDQSLEALLTATVDAVALAVRGELGRDNAQASTSDEVTPGVEGGAAHRAPELRGLSVAGVSYGRQALQQAEGDIVGFTGELLRAFYNLS